MQNHIEKRHSTCGLFFYMFVCLLSSLTQLWLGYLVYKHEKERNALKLMHISLHLKESCVNVCIDEVLWGLKALHRVETSECAKEVCSPRPENGPFFFYFFFFSKSCIPVNVPALSRCVFFYTRALSSARLCGHMLHSQYVTVWMKVSA